MVTAGIAALAALLAVFATGQATGSDVVDPLYRGCFAAGITLATARSRRWTWFVLAGGAAVFAAGDDFAVALAATGIVLAALSMFHGRHQRELGALVGLVSVNALLRLPTAEWSFGVPSLAAAVIPIPVAWTAWRNLRRPRRVTIAVGVLGGALVVIVAAFAFTMLAIERDARVGVDAARDGMRASGLGQRDAAADDFAIAETELRDLERSSRAWWLQPVRLVPVLAQQLHAIEQVAGSTGDLAALGADQIDVFDPEILVADGGRIDLDAITRLAPRVSAAVDAVSRTRQVSEDADSGWLLPPLAERVGELRHHLERIEPVGANVADALAAAPDLLGGSGERRYLVIVGNPAEAREYGGFASAFGVLHADGGVLSYEPIPGVSALGNRISTDPRDLSDLPAPLPAGFPTSHVQNWTDSVDFAAIDTLARRLGPQVTGGPVDGTLYLDPYVIASLLTLTGPVDLPAFDTTLTGANAVDFLVRDQYTFAAALPQAERSAALDGAVAPVLQRLITGDLPDVRDLVEALDPMVDARRLAFRADDRPLVADLLARVGLDTPLDPGDGDFLSVGHRSVDAVKTDAYIERSIDYRVDVDHTGALRGTLSITVTNAAPVDLPEYVTGADADHDIVLSAYTRAPVVAARIDGAVSEWSTADVGELRRNAVRVTVPRGGSVEVVFDVRSQIDADDYRLTVVPNAGATLDMLTVRANLDGSVRNVATDVLTERRVVGDTDNPE